MIPLSFLSKYTLFALYGKIVTVSSACSSARNVQSNEIQGSVVKPTLFNLSITDIQKVTHYIELFMFADDVSSLITIDKHDDPGISRRVNLSQSKHVGTTATKVSRLGRMFCAVFTSRSKEFMRCLWVPYLRPKLEYGC